MADTYQTNWTSKLFPDSTSSFFLQMDIIWNLKVVDWDWLALLAMVGGQKEENGGKYLTSLQSLYYFVSSSESLHFKYIS